ncbi:hypothetical protein G3578_14340 [Brevibacillus sp. SYP-B805]|uniref:hypothetical protein n=1 Tax=Brevibacillus sp. SYP-B805 TaxID=1578199 RepID=UPI0013EA1414|nr:hypothetical protein [Brevibacillus sp. SYP-B805]NGQ96341.1 hypothetical protein [Brevibacillus sp. SYP-B805]
MESTSFPAVRLAPDQVRYRVSCLFELAASLHLLCRTPAAQPADEWMGHMQSVLSQLSLMPEFCYFAPAFSQNIPWIFHPNHTVGITGPEEMFTYITNLSVRRFREAFSLALRGKQLAQVHLPSALEVDLQRDAEFVKGRFSLFLSAYWESAFAAAWQEVAPALEKEGLRIEEARMAPEKMLSFLRAIPLPLGEGSPIGSDSHADSSPASVDMRLLVLYPSWFYPDDAAWHIQDGVGHLLYRIPQKHDKRPHPGSGCCPDG